MVCNQQNVGIFLCFVRTNTCNARIMTHFSINLHISQQILRKMFDRNGARCLQPYSLSVWPRGRQSSMFLVDLIRPPFARGRVDSALNLSRSLSKALILTAHNSSTCMCRVRSSKSAKRGNILVFRINKHIDCKNNDTF